MLKQLISYTDSYIVLTPFNSKNSTPRWRWNDFQTFDFKV